MKSTFKSDGLPNFSSRYENFLSWCNQRGIEETLAENEAHHESTGSIKAPNHRQNNFLFQAPSHDSADSGFEAGSVHLLSSSLTNNEYRPIYILSLGEWTTNWSWFIPFSNYTAPATDWEILTELEPQPLQVLQVWNARSCPNDLLSRAWFITNVEPTLIESAKGLYRRMVSGDEAILSTISNRIGTKVFEANDPRLAYLKEEMEILDHLTGLALQHDDSGCLEDDQNVVPFTTAIPDKNAQVSLAAAGDSPDRELAFHSWQIEGSEVRIHLVELMAVPDGFILRVEGDLSEMLEESVIYDGQTSRLGMIQNGSAGSSENPLRFPTSSLRIELSDGQAVQLVMLEN